jgi:hypothetical protein
MHNSDGVEAGEEVDDDNNNKWWRLGVVWFGLEPPEISVPPAPPVLIDHHINPRLLVAVVLGLISLVGKVAGGESDGIRKLDQTHQKAGWDSSESDSSENGESGHQ